jgi:hypothetical protein
MHKIIELLKEKSITLLLGAIVGVLSFLGSIVWVDLGVPFAEKVLPSVPNRSLLAILLMQSVLLLVAFVSFLFMRNKARKYRFDKHQGIWYHKTTGEPFCPSCLSHNLESPLQQDAYGWRCGVKSCEKYYSNPDYVSPPHKRINPDTL